MADKGFLIDGIAYPVPTLDSFTMDEAEILYKCSGLTLEDFAVDEDDPAAAGELQRNIRNPGFIRAMMTVAYIRGNPSLSEAKAASVIGKSNLVEAIKNFIESAGDADPPEQQRSGSEKPDSVASSESSSVDSGGTSEDDSGGLDAIPEPIGTSA